MGRVETEGRRERKKRERKKRERERGEKRVTSSTCCVAEEVEVDEGGDVAAIVRYPFFPLVAGVVDGWHEKG